MFSRSGKTRATQSGVLKWWSILIAITLVITAGLMPTGAAQTPCDPCNDVAVQVAFLVDVGTGIAPGDFAGRLSAIAGAINAIPADGKTEVTIIEHADANFFLEIGPVVIDSEATRTGVADGVMALDQETGTELDDAISLAYSILTGSPNFDCATRSVIIGFIDEPIGDEADATDARNDALAAGIDEINIISTGTLDPGETTFVESLLYPQPASIAPDDGYHLNFADEPAFAIGIATIASDLITATTSDLSISVSGTPDVYAGNEVFYTIEVCNNGPLDVTGISFVNTLPPEVEYLADSLDSGVVTPVGTGDEVAFSGIDLACGECLTVVIKGRVDSDAVVVQTTPVPSPLENAAFTAINTVELLDTQSNPDDFPDNNIDNFGTFIQEMADIKVSRVADSLIVPVGQEVGYRIIIENFGPSDAREVIFREDYPFNDTFIGTSLSVRNLSLLPSPFAICGVPGENGFGFNFPWHINICAPLPADDSVELVINIASTDPDDSQVISGETYVTTVSNDPDMTNNTASSTVLVEATSDLSISKTVTGEVQDIGAVAGTSTPTANAVTAGLTMTYNIEVANDGPSVANNVVVTDLLPAGVSLVQDGVVLSQGTVSYGIPGDPGAPLVCTLGTIEDGDPPVTIDVTVLVGANTAPGTVLNNSVSVTSDAVESEPIDNTASAQALVSTWADTKITKLSVGENITGFDTASNRNILEDLPGRVTAGRELRYEITVQNDGPSDAQTVQILDILPGQEDTGLIHDPVTLLRVVGAEYTVLDELQELGIFGPAGGKFGQVLWASLGPLSVGERRTIQIYVQTDTSIPDGTTLTNGAFVWWGPSSPPPGFLGYPFPQIPAELPTTDDPFVDNNYADTDTNVSVVTDLEIEKTMTSDGIQPDSTIEFEVTITNHGPGDAQDVFFDEIWSGINVPVITPNFSVDIPAGQSFTWSVVIDIDPSEIDTPEFTNTVNLTSLTTDLNPDNNSSTVVIGGDDSCKKPLVPLNLIASDGVRAEEVVLTWDKVDDATSYVVYRSVTPRFDEAEHVATVLHNRYLDFPPKPEDLSNGPTPLSCVFASQDVYFYWVEAVNLCGNSEASNMDQGYAGFTAVKSNASTIPTGDAAILGLTLFAGYVITVRRRKKSIVEG